MVMLSLMLYISLQRLQVMHAFIFQEEFEKLYAENNLLKTENNILKQQLQRKGSDAKSLSRETGLSKTPDTNGLLLLTKKLQDAQRLYEKVKTELSRTKEVCKCKIVLTAVNFIFLSLIKTYMYLFSCSSLQSEIEVCKRTFLDIIVITLLQICCVNE